MAPSRRPEGTLDEREVAVLLDIAESCLAAALRGEAPAVAPLADLPERLHSRVGAFVSLHVDGELNGCIGHIEGVDPIGHDVARLALSAAFDDPRLPSLRPADWSSLVIELSVLSPLEPLPVGSRSELVHAVEPERHGVAIGVGSRQGLFLPSVWEQLPHPDDFLDQLWLKAGIAPRTWPRGLRVSRFTAERHERAAGARRIHA